MKMVWKCKNVKRTGVVKSYWGRVTIVSNFGSSEEGAACTGKPACLSETCFFKVEKLGVEKSQ